MKWTPAALPVSSACCLTRRSWRIRARRPCGRSKASARRVARCLSLEEVRSYDRDVALEPGTMSLRRLRQLPESEELWCAGGDRIAGVRLLAGLVACLAVVGVAGACKSSHNAVRPAASVPAPASGSTTSAPTSSTVSATAVSACATSPATSTTARASTATTTLQHTSTTAGTGTTATVPPNTSTTLAPNTPAPTCYVTRTNVKLRASPSVSSTPVGVVPGGTKLQVQCIATGETVDRVGRLGFQITVIPGPVPAWRRRPGSWPGRSC